MKRVAFDSSSRAGDDQQLMRATQNARQLAWVAIVIGVGELVWLLMLLFPKTI